MVIKLSDFLTYAHNFTTYIDVKGSICVIFCEKNLSLSVIFLYYLYVLRLQYKLFRKGKCRGNELRLKIAFILGIRCENLA